MPAIPRLNGIIRALEAGKTAMATFVSPPTVDGAIALSTAKYDGVIFEYEHQPYDIGGLRDSLQYMLNRRQVLDRGSLAPAVTPLVRIPPNGAEMSQWVAKQVLDVGVYGVVWPHVSTVDEAYNAVAACAIRGRRASPPANRKDSAATRRSRRHATGD
jgi:4-hydroxy-2-oxoheptanedioate aldolase